MTTTKTDWVVDHGIHLVILGAVVGGLTGAAIRITIYAITGA